MYNIILFTPVWQRPEIFDICLKGINRLVNYKPKEFNIKPFFIISESSAAYKIHEYGFDYMFHNNQPLGEKKNNGLKYVLDNYHFDYIMELNSDDLATNDTLDLVKKNLDRNVPQFTLDTCYFIDTKNGDIAKFQHRIMGAARFISKDAIKRFKKYVKGRGYRIWDDDGVRAMDTYSASSLKMVSIDNKIIPTDGVPYLLDMKSDVNIHTFDNFKKEDINTMDVLNRFPEKEDILKLINK